MTVARAFLAGAIDYAGLFPPASLDMRRAVDCYSEYLAGPHRDLLGRFIVPVARIDELIGALKRNNGAAGEPWRVSVVAAIGFIGAPDIARINRDYRDIVLCDAIELPVKSAAEIETALGIPEAFELFLEIPLSTDPEPLIGALPPGRAAAKIRTGGVVESAIPSAEEVLRFIDLCQRHHVRFKATAGLHHAIRGSYPLTYDVASAEAIMFGYLNVFLAAAFSMAGAKDVALAVLTESDASAFSFGDGGVSWRGQLLSKAQLAETRLRSIVSFGSCSFTEPVEEATALKIL